jgi:hypothetical protein
MVISKYLPPVTAAVSKPPICHFSGALPYPASCPLASGSHFYLETFCPPCLFLVLLSVRSLHWWSMELWSGPAEPAGPAWVTLGKRRARVIADTCALWWEGPRGCWWGVCTEGRSTRCSATCHSMEAHKGLSTHAEPIFKINIKFT